MNNKRYNIGLDAGSTTLKLVATDGNGNIVYTDYQRHYADISGTLQSSLVRMREKMGDVEVSFCATGSAGMGISERFGLPFIQEVVAATRVVEVKYPETKTLIDIGGEDSKMIFFNQDMQPDIRMNGNCAGGTGAFIDQMAAILSVDVSEMSHLALNAQTTYPIASRCGVFSKTDIQNLIALNVSRENIAASIFNAVITQVISALSHGCDIKPKIFLCGGPFAFIPVLKQILMEKLSVSESDIILDPNASVIPSWGASLSIPENSESLPIETYIKIFSEKKEKIKLNRSDLEPLFKNETSYHNWVAEKESDKIEKIEIEDLESDICYVGIDSGSTTTKVVAMDEQERIFFTFYKKNGGRPLETVKEGLSLLQAQAKENGKSLRVKAGCSTGYGEELIKTAFNLNYGMVETIAHYTAACKMNPNVSFILDIGGQDMKAIFVENGAINRLEINEACSSGCGSFIDSFASSLKCPISEFVECACKSQNPADLGTRCTVFMNSKVKQCLREGTSLADISAGLAYSVVKNCLYKVLKLKNMDELGNHIVLQGGTMRNKAVVRAFECSTGKKVSVSNFPELMGAYGAALFSKKRVSSHPEEAMDFSLQELSELKDYTSEPFRCVGCENNCQILKNTFANGKTYYSGNKCEKVYTNKGEKIRTAFNLSLNKAEMSFKSNANNIVKEPILTLGIPRVLNMYENYPFWYTLFSQCGINVVKSSRSTFQMYENGLSSVMADNICFPAKLVHGHILNLVEKKVDRIFFPYVVFEAMEKNANNSFNCPIVSGYSDVIKSSIDTKAKYDIPLDAPIINFKERDLLRKACQLYISQLVRERYDEEQFQSAFQKAIEAQNTYTRSLHDKANDILEKARKENRFVILLAGRPYHNDSLIQHKVSEIITSFGVDVITEDLIRYDEEELENTHIIPQWSYMNRIMKAAQWTANTEENVHFIQITSFGCGPDAFIIDEVNDILKQGGKNLTLLKVDDVNNAGSLRLRIRSLIESLKFKTEEQQSKARQQFKTTPAFTEQDRHRKILCSHFSEFHSPFLPPVFKIMGYELENLPPSDAESAKLGLKYANNEVCYPATLVVGDCIRAIESGRYKKEEICFAITQTGGQCRATNYIALIKKALVAAGYGDIPVISISIMNTINSQPGFTPDVKKIALITLYALYYGDALSKMYYAAAVREKELGSAAKLKEKYLKKGVEAVYEKNAKKLLQYLKEAALAFDEIVEEKNVPRIGIVGEIFIKYNSFGHQHIVDWLVKEGIEPVIPSLNEFFLQYFPNAKFNEKNFLEEKQSFMTKLLTMFGKKIVHSVEKKINKASAHFRYYEDMTNIEEEAEKASKIVSLAAQFGEGWLIPAEIASFAERGINAAISLQPFGCIANHVISKGIEKKIKDIYPNMNLLFLDFDGGVSEVNVLNRLHFIAKAAKNNLQKDRK